MTIPRLFWRIRGHDGFKDNFEMNVDLWQFTEDGIKHLLRSLVAAKAGLSESEIFGAHARRKTKIANNLLAVRKDFGYPTYSCGNDPSFTASVVDEYGKITRHRTLQVTAQPTVDS